MKNTKWMLGARRMHFDKELGKLEVAELCQSVVYGSYGLVWGYVDVSDKSSIYNAFCI